MRCACIDIGSNTTRLLVAEAVDGRLREVVARRAFTRLGSAGDDDIPAGKVSEVAAVVAEQAGLARAAGAQRIRIVATAAIRRAANREAFTSAVELAAGVPVGVLSGADEARLAFAGATSTLGDAPGGELGVVDVGGGSSELVVGTRAGGVVWSTSLCVGSALLTDAHLHSDPPAAHELERLRANVGAVFEGLDAPQPRAAYAVGGSATSLQRFVGPELTHASLREALDVLAAISVEGAARRFGLHHERARILPAGMLLLDAAISVLGCPLRIVTGGLREGVILDELEE